MPFSILDRYLMREIVISWAGVTAVLFFIMLSHTFVRVLTKAGEDALGTASVLPLLLANSANLLVTIVPLDVFLGVILGLGRLYQDSEMVAMTPTHRTDL